ncbi:hypothetical protein LTR27_008630 [Elasticomyces elasticus]|nr:hypothetical protein LTR27_008630 [Elasticomyces elasticus]
MATQPVTFPYAQYDCYKFSIDLEAVSSKFMASIMFQHAAVTLHDNADEGCHLVKFGPRSNYIVYAVPSGRANPLVLSDTMFESCVTIEPKDCSPYHTKPISEQIEALRKHNEPARIKHEKLEKRLAEQQQGIERLDRFLRGDFSHLEGNSA